MQTIKELSSAIELFLAHHVPRDKYWVDTWFDSEEPVILCWLLEKIVYPMQWEKARRHKYGHDSSPEVHTVPGVKTLVDNFEFSAERWSKVLPEVIMIYLSSWPVVLKNDHGQPRPWWSMILNLGIWNFLGWESQRILSSAYSHMSWLSLSDLPFFNTSRRLGPMKKYASKRNLDFWSRWQSGVLEPCWTSILQLSHICNPWVSRCSFHLWCIAEKTFPQNR